MKKLDLEAKLFMYILKLKEEKEKNYSTDECEHNIAYVFENYKSFEDYFINNGVEPAYSYGICDLCMMKRTKKGSIIALKGLCDYSISKLNQKGVQEIPKTYKDTLIETIEQYLPMTYEEFKKLDLDEQQSIIDEIKLKQGRVEKDLFQDRFERLVMLSADYSEKEGEQINKAEAKILSLRK